MAHGWFENFIEVLRSLFVASAWRTELEQSRHWILDQIDKANLIRLLCGPEPSLSYNKDEEVLCVLPQTNLAEPRPVRRSHSVYGGMSARVMKGMYVRSGSGDSASESHEELRAVDKGTLVLTNQRLIFIGALRTTNTPLEDILSMDASRSHVRVNRGTKSRADYYIIPKTLRVPVEDGKSLAVHGPMVQAAIHQAVENRKNPEGFKLMHDFGGNTAFKKRLDETVGREARDVILAGPPSE